MVVEVGQQAAQRIHDAFGPLREGASDFWNAARKSTSASQINKHPSKARRSSKAKDRKSQNSQIDRAASDEATLEEQDLVSFALPPTVQPQFIPMKKKIPTPAVNTVIIEALVKITDDSNHNLIVTMLDTCDSAARRFIHNHMQRAWFEEPLAAWLRQAESDAVTLPVKIEGDLKEIRKQHSKRA